MWWQEIWLTCIALIKTARRKEEARMFFVFVLPIWITSQGATAILKSLTLPSSPIKDIPESHSWPSNWVIPEEIPRTFSPEQDNANLPAEHLDIDMVFVDVAHLIYLPESYKRGVPYIFIMENLSCKLVCKCVLLGIRLSKDDLILAVAVVVVVAGAKNNL